MEMAVIGLVVLGALLGAAGTEVLRSKNPELIKKIEDHAKRFVDGLGLAKSADEKEDK